METPGKGTQFKSFEALRKQISDKLFSLKNEIDLAIYKKQSNGLERIMEDAKEQYVSLREDADIFFGIGGYTPFESQGQAMLSSNIVRDSSLATKMDGLEALDTLSIKIKQGNYDQMLWLLTYPRVLQENLKLINQDLESFKDQEFYYLGLLEKELKPTKPRHFLNDKEKGALLEYRKSRENHLKLVYQLLTEAQMLIEDSIKDQTTEEQRSAPIKVEEEEKKLDASQSRQSSFIKNVQKYGFKVNQTVIRTYDLKVDYCIKMIGCAQMVYVGNSDDNIDVFGKNMKYETTIDILGQKLQQCVEVDSQFLLCASFNKKLQKYSLKNYTCLQSHQMHSSIYHILWLNQSFIAVSLLNGELVLFDYQQFQQIHAIKLSTKKIYQAVKCLENENQLLVCSEEGVFEVDLNNQNEVKLIDQKYYHNEQISCIFQIDPFQYIIGYFQNNNKLVGIMERKSKTFSFVTNPLQKNDGACSIEKIKGLSNVAIIQTDNDLFLLNCSTHQATHLISNYYHWLGPSTMSEFDSKHQCLKIHAIQETIQQKNILKFEVELKNASVSKQQ